MIRDYTHAEMQAITDRAIKDGEAWIDRRFKIIYDGSKFILSDEYENETYPLGRAHPGLAAAMAIDKVETNNCHCTNNGDYCESCSMRQDDILNAEDHP